MLNINHIDIISKGESEQLEFKKSTGSIREIIETVCAFANNSGGKIYVGVTDNGRIAGQQVTDDTLKNLANEIKLNTDPKIYPSISKIELEDKNCILIAIEESPLKPHLAYGRPYLRVSSSNQQIDRESYQNLLLQRNNGYGFDYQINNKVSISDIDTEALYNFIEKANAYRSFNENLLLPVDLLLEKLGLHIYGKLTNASILLFGKEPSKYFLNQYEIKCGTFTTEKSFNPIFNDKVFSCNLFEIFDATYAYLVNAINKVTVIEASSRKENFEFPLSALREIVVNMIVHRDYRQGIKSTIEVRPSQIIFQNPATLFSPTITIEKLKTPHPSRPGNKLIAKVFYLAGLFENWGSGTIKIIDLLENNQNKEPEFSFVDGMFKLSLGR